MSFSRFELRLDGVLSVLGEGAQSDKRDDILSRLEGESVVVAGKLDRAKSPDLFLVKRAGIIAGIGSKSVIPIDHIHVDNSSIRGLKMGGLVAIRGVVGDYVRSDGSVGFTLFDVRDVTSSTNFGGYDELAAKNALDVFNVDVGVISPEYVKGLDELDEDDKFEVAQNEEIKNAINSVVGRNLDKPIDKGTRRYLSVIDDVFDCVLRGQDDSFAYYEIYDTLVNKLVLKKSNRSHFYVQGNEVVSSPFVYAYVTMKRIDKDILPVEVIGEFASRASGFEYKTRGDSFVVRSYFGDDLFVGPFPKCVTKLREAGGLLKGYICPSGINHDGFIKYFVLAGSKSTDVTDKDWVKYFKLTPKVDRYEHVQSELSDKQKRAIEKREAEKKQQIVVPRNVEIRKPKARNKIRF